MELFILGMAVLTIGGLIAGILWIIDEGMEYVNEEVTSTPDPKEDLNAWAAFWDDVDAGVSAKTLEERHKAFKKWAAEAAAARRAQTYYDACEALWTGEQEGVTNGESTDRQGV